MGGLRAIMMAHIRFGDFSIEESAWLMQSCATRALFAPPSSHLYQECKLLVQGNETERSERESKYNNNVSCSDRKDGGARETGGQTGGETGKRKEEKDSEAGWSTARGRGTVKGYSLKSATSYHSTNNARGWDRQRCIKAFGTELEYLEALEPTEYIPHGLYNYGNTCFLNSVLHALFSCQDIRGMLYDLKGNGFPEEAPVLQAFVEFTKIVITEELGSSMHRGASFYPSVFTSLVEKFCCMTSGPGYSSSSLPQQDAQEFLLHVVDQLHEEMISLRKKATSELKSSQDALAGFGDDEKGGGGAANNQDEWEEVGKNNKSAVTRRHTTERSRMSSIFGGLLKSTVRTTEAKPSVCIEPFSVLQLDISPDEVDSVSEAMKRFSAPEYLDDYAPNCVASKTVQIEEAPLVLVIQLLRFSYTHTGHSIKLTKKCEILDHLDVETTASGPPLDYELFATVSHHGNSLQNGHYTADIKDSCGQWFHCDDEEILSGTSHFGSDDVYIIMYRRKD